MFGQMWRRLALATLPALVITLGACGSAAKSTGRQLVPTPPEAASRPAASPAQASTTPTQNVIADLDSVVTLIVSAYILVQSFPDIRRSIHILMQGAPADVSSEQLVAAMQAVEGVEEIHHLHLWELDEHERALEAHVVVRPTQIEQWSSIKRELKLLIGEQFHIHHSTLELESSDETGCQPCPPNGLHRC